MSVCLCSRVFPVLPYCVSVSVCVCRSACVCDCLCLSASVWSQEFVTFSGIKPSSAMKVNLWMCTCATDSDLERGCEYEHKCQDPKDGELCMRRANSRKIMVETPGDTGEQNVRKTLV